MSDRPRDGRDGRDGLRGPPGTDGLDGLTAFEIARAKGFVGAEDAWLASLKGDRGDKGDPGRDGASIDPAAVREMVKRAFDDAPKPLDGLKGDKGDPGPLGLPGNDGKDAVPPPLKPWAADFYRNSDLTVQHMHVYAKDGTSAMNAFPEYFEEGGIMLIKHVDILPA